MAARGVESLRVRAVAASVGRVYRASWLELLVLGLALFVPLGLLTALAPGDGIEIQRLDDPRLIPIVAVGAAQVIAPLIGTVLFAGIVTSAVRRERGGDGHRLREIARDLPYGRLIAADILLVLAFGFGLLLFLIPGIVALVWFSLVAPVIEQEDTTVRDGFRRSRGLVRGHFRQVAALVVPAVLAQVLIEAAVEAGAFAAFGHGFAAEWFAAAAGDLLADPVFALIVVTLYFDLRALEGERAPAGS